MDNPAVAERLNSMIVSVAKKAEAPNRSRAKAGKKIFGK
jgi:hypothetical protein